MDSSICQHSSRGHTASCTEPIGLEISRLQPDGKLPVGPLKRRLSVVRNDCSHKRRFVLLARMQAVHFDRCWIVTNNLRTESKLMQRVKLFKSIESELLNLEKEINEWIMSTGARVISVTGNIAPQSGSTSGIPMGSFSASDVLVVIMYEDGNAH